MTSIVWSDTFDNVFFAQSPYMPFVSLCSLFLIFVFLKK